MEQANLNNGYGMMPLAQIQGEGYNGLVYTADFGGIPGLGCIVQNEKEPDQLFNLLFLYVQRPEDMPSSPGTAGNEKPLFHKNHTKLNSQGMKNIQNVPANRRRSARPRKERHHGVKFFLQTEDEEDLLERLYQCNISRAGNPRETQKGATNYNGATAQGMLERLLKQTPARTREYRLSQLPGYAQKSSVQSGRRTKPGQYKMGGLPSYREKPALYTRQNIENLLAYNAQENKTRQGQARQLPAYDSGKIKAYVKPKSVDGLVEDKPNKLSQNRTGQNNTSQLPAYSHHQKPYASGKEERAKKGTVKNRSYQHADRYKQKAATQPYANQAMQKNTRPAANETNPGYKKEKAKQPDSAYRRPENNLLKDNDYKKKDSARNYKRPLEKPDVFKPRSTHKAWVNRPGNYALPPGRDAYKALQNGIGNYSGKNNGPGKYRALPPAKNSSMTGMYKNSPMTQRALPPGTGTYLNIPKGSYARAK